MKKFPGEYVLTDSWNGPAPKEQNLRYEEFMLKHIFHLCPRGAGHDSARFFESCLLGRIPIVIGDNRFFGEGKLDTSFCLQISQYLPNTLIEAQLRQFFNMSWPEIEDRCKRAQLYFESVREYFKNPTQYLLKDVYGLSFC